MIGGLREGGTPLLQHLPSLDNPKQLCIDFPHTHMRARNRRCDASLARE
jgi:hypothetical protein